MTNATNIQQQADPPRLVIGGRANGRCATIERIALLIGGDQMTEQTCEECGGSLAYKPSEDVVVCEDCWEYAGVPATEGAY